MIVVDVVCDVIVGHKNYVVFADAFPEEGLVGVEDVGLVAVV
jgi:hypothetical protein